LLTLAATVTRLWGLGYGNRVAWDEAHFGRFGTMYLNGTYIHDVHPPLAKMIIALAQHWAGHNGTYTFTSGEVYPEWVNYTMIRAQVAVFGIALVPLAYLTCKRLGVSLEMSILASVFVLFDNAICLMTRLIVLDGPLLALTALALFCLASFQDECSTGTEFSRRWWGWLMATGVSLGLVLSAKWVGAFSVALVGVSAVGDLHSKLCSHTSWRRYLGHWLARALALIAVPIAVYAAVFRVHFSFQTEKGFGEDKMSLRFQARLRGNRYNHQPYDIAYGGIVKIKPEAPGGCGLLQSTRADDGDREAPQPVGCKEVESGADWWVIRHPFGVSRDYSNGTEVDLVRHQSLVTLANDLFQKTLYVDSSVQLNASKGAGRSTPWFSRFYSVQAVKTADITATGENTNWVLEIVEQEHKGDDRELETFHPINSVFRLRHAATQCVLALPQTKAAPEDFAAGTLAVCVLPDEIADKTPAKHTLWRVEFNVDLRQGFDRDISSKIRTSFLTDMVQQNIVMARTNNELIPDADKYNHLESSPWSWPLLLYPMRMGDWGPDGGVKFYELGNPLLWWATAVLCCLVYPLRAVYWLCARRWRDSRGRGAYSRERCRRQGGVLWLGWALHYLAFFLMGRVTYIHHYLPALYFALLLLAQEIDRVADAAILKARRAAVLGAVSLLVAAVFWHFRKFTYGWDHSPGDLAHLQWLGTWNIFEDR
ncbi:PMT-domain-containing protein, partial [Martensiomyces pterosporus]